MKNNFSFGAIVGYLSGIIILINAISIFGQGTSAIHQIYEILSFGFGFSLIVLGSIAQHTKNGKGLGGLLGFPDASKFEKKDNNE